MNARGGGDNIGATVAEDMGGNGCANSGGVDKEEPQVKVGGEINNGDTVTCRAADGGKKEGARAFRDSIGRQ